MEELRSINGAGTAPRQAKKPSLKKRSPIVRIFKIIGIVFISIFEELWLLLKKIPKAAYITVLCLCICGAGAVFALRFIPQRSSHAEHVSLRASDCLLGAREHIVSEEERLSFAEKEQKEETEEAPEDYDEENPVGTAQSYTVTFDFYDREDITCVSEEIRVSQLMALAGIKLTDSQMLRISENEMIRADMVIPVDEIIYKSVFSEEYIPYETVYKDVQTIPKGTTKTYKNGINGTRTSEYLVKYVNGTETDRTFVGKTETAPTNAIVYRGIGGTVNIGGVIYNYSYRLEVQSTYYTGGGITATGLPASEEVIAVDPRVIPYGTKVYIPYVGNIRIAADTGGAVRGNTIDVYLNEDNPLCKGYGRRTFTVYILE